MEMSKYKGPYKKPVVTAIKLDPGQAVIVVCRVNNAVWMISEDLGCSQPGGTFLTCNLPVRGVGGRGTEATAGSTPTEFRPS